MSETPEAKVRNPCLKLAKKCGLFHKRMHFGYGAARGWPDDLFLYKENGVAIHIWVEFKREGGEATPKQDEIHTLMREFGCIVWVIDSIEQFALLLSPILGFRVATYL